MLSKAQSVALIVRSTLPKTLIAIVTNDDLIDP